MAGTPSDTIRQFWDIPDVVDGAWAERRRLARSLRLLNERCLTSEGDLERAAELVEAALELLDPGPTSRDAYRSGAYFETPSLFPDRGALMGNCNPIAPPMKPQMEGDTAVCELVLDERYVGAPGMVHGGIVAACFDQICGHAVVLAGYGALTTVLNIRYHKPVPLHAEVRYEAVVGQKKRRRISVRGRCLREGVVVADCEATFVALAPSEARNVIERA